MKEALLWDKTYTLSALKSTSLGLFVLNYWDTFTNGRNNINIQIFVWITIFATLSVLEMSMNKYDLFLYKSERAAILITVKMADSNKENSGPIPLNGK